MKLRPLLVLLFALTASAVFGSDVHLTWTDNANNETGFAIERAPAAPSTAFVEIARVGPNVVTFDDLGLPNSTAFQWRVRAFNLGGFSSYSNVATVTTLPPPPAAPSDATATVITVVTTTTITVTPPNNGSAVVLAK